MTRPRGFGSRANVVMLATILFMFAASSVVWALSLAHFIMIIRTVDSSDPIPPHEYILDTNPALEHVEVLIEVISTINVCTMLPV